MPITKFTLFAALIVSISSPARAEQWQFDDVERVVAIADVQGAYDAMVRGLQSAAVIDEQMVWTAGNAHLVIVGDIVDRGPNSRAAMDLLMRLETEAVAAGGMVHVLLGNHEVMNLVGDLRYVSDEEYAAFAGEELAEDRDRWFSVYADRRASGVESPEGLSVGFAQRFPPGFFGHRRAFSSAGKYGKWLLTKPAVVVINGTAFVHGGLSPTIGQIGLDGVNGRLRGEMVDYVKQLEIVVEAGALLPTDSFHEHARLLGQYLPPLDTPVEVLVAIDAVKKLNGSRFHALDGPLWYRGNIVCSELIESDKLAGTLRAIGATRVVIGHTPTPGRRVLQRLNGRIIEIDTGMLNNYYGGSANVLILDDDSVSVINETGDEAVAPLAHPREVGARPQGRLSTAAIEELLTSGEIISRSEDATGHELVTVSDGTYTIDSILAKRSGRGFIPEVAAYRLDRLLKLDMVPVAVAREIDGASVSLQFHPVRWINETRRQQEGQGGSAWCPLSQQWNAMFVFDVLTHNDGRNGLNIHYDLSQWQVMLVDHGRAFSTSSGVPKALRDVPYEVGDAWRDAIASLTDEVLQQHLGDVLDKKRLEALGKRRDALLKL